MQNKLKIALTLAKENPNIDVNMLLDLVGEGNDNPTLDKPEYLDDDDKKEGVTAWKKYSKNESISLLNMYKKGVPIKEIADELGRDVRSVNNRLNYMKSNGWAPEKRRNHKYTQDEDELIHHELKSVNYEVNQVPRETIKSLSGLIEVTDNAIKSRMYQKINEWRKTNASIK